MRQTARFDTESLCPADRVEMDKGCASSRHTGDRITSSIKHQGDDIRTGGHENVMRVARRRVRPYPRSIRKRINALDLTSFSGEPRAIEKHDISAAVDREISWLKIDEFRSRG